MARALEAPLPLRQPPCATQTIDALSSLVRTLRAIHMLADGDGDWVALDLTMAQLKALILVVDTGGLPSSRLADRLGVGPSAVTPLVDGLIRERLVRRVHDASDRRMAWVRPTQKALALHEKLLRTNRSVLTDVLSALSPAARPAVDAALQCLLTAAEQALVRHQEKVVRHQARHQERVSR